MKDTDKENLLELPSAITEIVLSFVGDIIEHAHQVAPNKWGLTHYQPNIRINVGFTEIFTTQDEVMRLIVDRKPTTSIKLPTTATVTSGEKGAAYYPSIPDSVCVELPYTPIRSLRNVLGNLRPALFEAIAKAGRNGLGKGVREGHNPELVRMVGRFLGRDLPQPTYVSQSSSSKLAIRFAEAWDIEGMKTEVTRFTAKRSRKLRNRAFDTANGVCCVCMRDFSKVLGGRGIRVLQVHHREQLAARPAPSVTKESDLAVVCANCHLLLHLDPDEALMVDDLKKMLREDGIYLS